MKKLLHALFLSYILLLSGCNETTLEESTSIENLEETINKDEIT